MHADAMILRLPCSWQMNWLFCVVVCGMMFLSRVYCIDQMFSKVFANQALHLACSVVSEIEHGEHTVLRIGETTSVVRTPTADKTHGSHEDM